MTEKPPRKILSDAIIKLLMEDPMWGCILIRLNVLMTRTQLPALGTDGKHLIVNPDWIKSVGFMVAVAGLVHEAVHIAFKHIFRRGSRDFKLWNDAIDHVTNLAIRKRRVPNTGNVYGYDIPDDWLCDRRFEGMSAEKVYDILKKEAEQANPPPPPLTPESDEDKEDENERGDGAGDNDQDLDQDQDEDKGEGEDQNQDQDENENDDQDQDQEGEEEEGESEGKEPETGKGKGEGDGEDAFEGKFDPNGPPQKRARSGLDDIVYDHDATGDREAARAAEEMVDLAIQAAYEAAKSAGKAPGFFSGMIEARHKHVIDYRELLRDWLAKNVFNQDYNWMVCDRRFVGSGFHIPALADGDGQAKILLIVDSSGSMWNERDLGKCAAEIQGVLEEFPGRYWVIYTDTVFQGIQEITFEEPLKLEPRGGGGTDFGAIMEHVRTISEIDWEAILFFTDMCTCSFGRDPEKPVLWMSTNTYKITPPFGRVINIGSTPGGAELN